MQPVSLESKSEDLMAPLITTKHPDHIGALKEGQLKPGDKAFTDQLESRVRGWLLHTAGREQESDRFCGSSMFVDAASGYVHIEHQVTVNATNSINAKSAFERMARDVGVDITKYHTDNGIYTSKAYVADLVLKESKHPALWSWSQMAERSSGRGNRNGGFKGQNTDGSCCLALARRRGRLALAAVSHSHSPSLQPHTQSVQRHCSGGSLHVHSQ